MVRVGATIGSTRGLAYHRGMDVTNATLQAGAIETPVSELTGTAKSIATAAERHGWDVRSARPVIHLIGTKHGRAFSARYGSDGKWDVRILRPGWPVMPADTITLRRFIEAT